MYKFLDMLGSLLFHNETQKILSEVRSWHSDILKMQRNLMAKDLVVQKRLQVLEQDVDSLRGDMKKVEEIHRIVIKNLS